MSFKWHYAAGRKADDDGGYCYEVHEVYDTDRGIVWTYCSVPPYGESRDELAADLERMLADVREFPAFDVEAEEYTELGAGS